VSRSYAESLEAALKAQFKTIASFQINNIHWKNEPIIIEGRDGWGEMVDGGNVEMEVNVSMLTPLGVMRAEIKMPPAMANYLVANVNCDSPDEPVEIKPKTRWDRIQE